MRRQRTEHHDVGDDQVEDEAVYDGKGQRAQVATYVVAISNDHLQMGRRSNDVPLLVNHGTNDNLILYGLLAPGGYPGPWHYYLGTMSSVHAGRDTTAEITPVCTADKAWSTNAPLCPSIRFGLLYPAG